MSIYSQIAWLPLTGGLTLAGLVASVLTWRRRGAAAGLRGVAWSLVPVAAYLIGAIELLWRFGTAIASFVTSFVFSPRVWAGFIVAGTSAVLFAVSGGLRRRRARKAVAGEPAVTRAGAGGKPGRAVARGEGAALAPGKGPAATAGDDDLGDVAEILRRRGIR